MAADRTAGSSGTAQPANPLQTITDALPRLKGATARVAQSILTAPERAAAGSITELAAGAGTSAATVTRLATQLGFNGYPALRAAIAMETGRAAQSKWERDIGSAIAPDDAPERVLNVLASTEVNAIRNALSALDLDAATRAAEAITAAGRVHIYGEWADAIPAKELFIRLLRIGLPVWFHEGNHSSHVGAGLLSAGDVALVLCRSGTDSIAEHFIRASAERGATTVVITGEPQSALAAAGEIVLSTGTRNGRTWTDYFAGRASDVLTAGLLFVLVAQRVPPRIAADNGPTGHDPMTDDLSDLPSEPISTLSSRADSVIDEPPPTEQSESERERDTGQVDREEDGRLP